jgi:hypothetical protein
MPIPEILLNPQPKFFRVRYSRFRKVHIAREPKTDCFKTLCGRKIPCSSAYAETITSYRGDECLRCQQCTSKKKYKLWQGWVRIIRLTKVIPNRAA